MKKIILLAVLFVYSIGFSQSTGCAFSDGFYHYEIELSEANSLTSEFDKKDFLNLLQQNSKEDTSAVEETILDVFQFSQDQQTLYVISTEEDLPSFMSSHQKVVTSIKPYCDYATPDGYYINHVQLTGSMPLQEDFSKTEFINYIKTKSHLSNFDLEFLDNSIFEVNKAFPETPESGLQRVVTVYSSYDLMTSYLNDFSDSVAYVELLNGEKAMKREDKISMTSSDILIAPNPVNSKSKIKIDQDLDMDHLTVYNANGKEVFMQNINQTSLVPLRPLNLETGMYYFKFSNAQRNIVKKVMVN